MCALAVAALVVVGVASVTASVPEDLSNYQNEYVCDASVRLVRCLLNALFVFSNRSAFSPLSVADVQEAVQRHDRISAVGMGRSWNREFFCAPSVDGGTAANIVMSTIRPLSIEVDESEGAVWVSAGVTVWDLMDYLGRYITPSAPRGYALGATPIYVNQTIGGAVATATHGSSLIHSSLSQQAIGFRVVLADGSLTEIFPDQSLLFRAMQVNVGRLCVVTDIKMRIVPERLIQRTLESEIAGDDFMEMLRGAQEEYKSTGSLPDWLQNAQAHWIPLDSTFLLYSFEEGAVGGAEVDADALSDRDASLETLSSTVINTEFPLSRSEGGLEIADGVGWSQPGARSPNFFYADPVNSATAMENAKEFFKEMGTAELETHRASISTPMEDVPSNSEVLSDGVEVTVGVDRMADCFQGVMDIIAAAGGATGSGLFNDITLRFVGREDGLLATSHDQPQMWMSFSDFVFYNQAERASNVQLKAVIAHMVASPDCAPGRLHWGKAGWPDDGCWNGAEAYPNTWCDFGCAVRSLDPDNKFIGSAPGVWNWRGASLVRCCTESGYDFSRDGCNCEVRPLRSSDDCPEAPFYSTR